MVNKPPRWAWLATGGMWGEHLRSPWHVANADPFSTANTVVFSIADRYDLANDNGTDNRTVYRQRGVWP